MSGSIFSPQKIKSCYTTGIMWYMGIPGFKQHILLFDQESSLIISFDYVPSHLNRHSFLYNQDQQSWSFIYQLFIWPHVLVWRFDHSSETNPQYHIYYDMKKRLAKNWKKVQSAAIYLMNFEWCAKKCCRCVSRRPAVSADCSVHYLLTLLISWHGETNMFWRFRFKTH